MAIALRNTSLQYLGSTPATPDWYFTPVVGDLLTLQGTDAAYITGIVDASGAVWQEAINHPVAAGATWPSGGYVQIWYTICTSTVSPALTITFNAAPNSDWIMDDWGGFTASVGTVLDAVGVTTGNSTTPVGPTNAQAGSNELFLVQGAMNSPGIGAATFTNSFIAPNSTLDVVGSDYFPAYLIATDSAAHGTAVSAAGSSAQPWTVVQVVFAPAPNTKFGIAAPASSASVGAGGIVTELGAASASATTSVSASGLASAAGIAAPASSASVGAAATLALLGAATASATASVSATYLSTSLAPVFTADTPTVTASVGVAYSYTFVASGSPSPTYSLSSGSLPPGLTLNTTTGVLSGTPTGLGGVYLFEIEATNSHGSATTPAIALVVSPAQAPYPVTYSPPITPHLALPLTVGPSGSFNVVVQDTLAEVTQSVSVLLGTMKGDRTMVPDYGVDDPTFATPNAGAITQAVNQWEPRAAVAVTVNPVANNTQQGVNVQVALAAEAAS